MSFSLQRPLLTQGWSIVLSCYTSMFQTFAAFNKNDKSIKRTDDHW